MSSLLDATPTRYLPLSDYLTDFDRVSGSLDGDIWKSERAQHFREPGNPSWEAFVAGRWDEAVSSTKGTLAELQAYYTALAGQGAQFFRARIVEFPLTAYLRWELHVLRVRAAAGEHIRIAQPHITGTTEGRYGAIPELVILGRAAGYVVDYGDDGMPRGAEKFVDTSAISRCLAALKELYDRSEEFEPFFAREVEPLGAPALDAGRP